MKIRLNENEKVVKMVKEGLKKKNGYCPCRLEMNEDTKCMCKEFREQIADENFEGYCHCMLYYKKNKYNFFSSSKKILSFKVGDELRPVCKIT